MLGGDGAVAAAARARHLAHACRHPAVQYSTVKYNTVQYSGPDTWPIHADRPTPCSVSFQFAQLWINEVINDKIITF